MFIGSLLFVLFATRLVVVVLGSRLTSWKSEFSRTLGFLFLHAVFSK